MMLDSAPPAPSSRRTAWPTPRAAEASRLISAFFDSHEAEAARLGRGFSALWAQIRQATDGGKKLRPDLVLVAHDELGGKDHQAALATAAAFELLHTAFLLHDDVIDGDTVRRGAANVIGAWSLGARSEGVQADRARQWGETAGILGGDLMIHFAIGQIARLDIDFARRSRLLAIFDDAMLTTAAGELDDVGLSVGVRAPSMTTVLAMTARKTARYSFGAPLTAGATIANADPGVLALLHDYGENTGTAFQLRDDILGVFGDSADTGKSSDSDLTRAAMTPLMAYALRTPARDDMVSALHPPDGQPLDAERIRHLLISSGALDFVTTLIASHVQRAQEAVTSSLLPSGLSAYLTEVSTAAGERSW